MMYFSEERCVMCGEIIPEGRMVCLRCERAASEQPKTPESTAPEGSVFSLVDNQPQVKT